MAVAPLARGGAAHDSTGTIVGWARDSLSRTPIQFASVVVVGTRIGTMTDASGWFRLRGVPVGKRLVRALAVWREKRVDSLEVHPGDVATLRFFMSLSDLSPAIIDTLWVAPGARPHHSRR